MHAWAEGFAAVDWGSTARRIYVLDAAGTVVRVAEDAAGAFAVPKHGFPAEVARLRAIAGDRPMLLAGMVGSNRGWMEAPYLPCPATVADIAARLLWAEPGRVAIVPGVSLVADGRGDVMRGEEVQVFGAEPGAARRLICHPGTHTKWIEVEHGAIARFRTIMTGELFGLLRAHGALADMIAGPAAANDAFARGVSRGFAEGDLAAELFAIRAGVLLGLMAREDAPSFASGLLIGCDLRVGLRAAAAGEEILVLGRGSLTGLYAAAIRQCGHTAREVDGAAAFVAGMRRIAETIA